MFLGDSLAAGYFATTRESGFSATVLAELRQVRADLESVTASKAGGTVRVGSVLDLPANVDVAVIELGTNDSLKTDPATFARRYAGLLRRIRAESPDAHLVCLGVWRRTWRAWPYDAVIATAARRNGGEFVRLSDLYRDSRTRGPAGRVVETGTTDNFHPNDHGHALIALRLLLSLREAVATRKPAASL